RHFSVLLGNFIAIALLAGCGGTSSTTTPMPASTASRPVTAPTANAPATSAPTTAARPTVTSPTAAAAGDPAAPKIALKLISDALNGPVYVTAAPDGSGRLFVVEKRGRILLLRGGAPAQTPVLDISDRVGSS